METKNFNELFESAKQVSDRRNKVFNQLIEKTASEITPKLLSVMESLDVDYIRVSTSTPSFWSEDPTTLETYEREYTVFIYDDGEIHEANYDFGPHGYEYQPTTLTIGNIKQKDCYKKVGIVELVGKLKEILAEIVEKAERQCKKAEAHL